MRVRPFRPGDEGALADIFFAAVHEIASQHYSDEQVQAWAPEVPPKDDFLSRARDGRTTLVATDGDGHPKAYADLEKDGNIDHFYCHPEVAGTGVAAALYDRLEADARGRGIDSLRVEASEPARRFFVKRGFAIVERLDFHLGAVPIHNFRMEKRLA